MLCHLAEKWGQSINQYISCAFLKGHYIYLAHKFQWFQYTGLPQTFYLFIFNFYGWGWVMLVTFLSEAAILVDEEIENLLFFSYKKNSISADLMVT